MNCKWHTCENDTEKVFCSKQCKNKHYVSENRRKNKAALVAEHGGKCIDCGYVGPAFMYDFDHRDPTVKSFGLAKSGITRSLSLLRLEAAKCDLVCSNCHRRRTHLQRCPGCDDCIPR